MAHHTKPISIGPFRIGEGHPPFVIAEMSANHAQSLDRAIAITKAAAKAGAHALKLQTFRASTLTIPSRDKGFRIENEDSLWHGRSLHSLYREAQTPWDWHEPIMQLARKLGMVCFSTPFDEAAVDYLERLGVPCHKIASFENTHLPLIRRVAATKKPLFLSTGMATQDELSEAIETARQAGAKDILLLKCTSAYPASPEDSHLRTLADLRRRFHCEVGISDHTLGMGVAIAATALGAVAIEKHFTLKRSDGGLDAAFSLEPKEMRSLVREVDNAWRSLGHIHYGPLPSEKASVMERRSLYIVKAMKRGEKLTEKNLRCIRPALGLAPKYYESLLGRKVRVDIKKATPLSWDLLA